MVSRLVIIDTKDSWAQQLVAAGTAEKLIQADLSDAEHVFDICMEAISQVEQVRLQDLGSWSLGFCSQGVWGRISGICCAVSVQARV